VCATELCIFAQTSCKKGKCAQTSCSRINDCRLSTENRILTFYREKKLIIMIIYSYIHKIIQNYTRIHDTMFFLMFTFFIKYFRRLLRFNPAKIAISQSVNSKITDVLLRFSY
jgi:hypothetical protein